MNIENEIKFVYEQIKNGNYILLPKEIAIGKVYKIAAFGSLEQDGYEIGYLYLPIGSGIKLHPHQQDIERYKRIAGVLSVKGEKVDFNICEIENTHNIDIVPEGTIIQTCKISKRYLDLFGEISNEMFDRVVYENLNYNVAQINMQQENDLNGAQRKFPEVMKRIRDLKINE